MMNYLYKNADAVSDLARMPLASIQHITVRQAIAICRRQILTIIVTILSLMGLTALFIPFITPQYTASLDIVFGRYPSTPIFDHQIESSDQPEDESAIISELDTIQSRNIAQQVVDALRLNLDPEFNETLREKRFWQIWVPSLYNRSEQLTQDNEKEQIIDSFLENLEAHQIPRSRTIAVSFKSENPITAARVANAVAKAYLAERLQIRFENARRASEWLASQLEKLRVRVEKSEQTVEEYRRQHELFDGREQVSLISERISDLNARLTDAVTTRLAAEANLAQARRLLASDSVDSASEVLDSVLIQKFREQELEFARRAASMNEKLGPMHPAMVQLQAERKALTERIRLEINKIVRSLENKVRIARSQEVELSQDLDLAKRQVAEANEASIGLRAWEREAEANRLLLEKFLDVYMESSAQEGVTSQSPDARVPSEAAVPNEPSFPRPLLLLAAAFAAATATGIMFAFIREGWQSGCRTGEEVEALIGIPVLARVPRVPSAGRGTVSYVIDHPRSAFAESIRGLYTNLRLANSSRSLKIVLVASAESDEGKTTICLSIARQQAKAGRRVLLLDVDLRSQLALLAGVRLMPGLSEVLAGSVNFDEALQSDTISNLDLLTSGTATLNHFNLLESTEFNDILAAARLKYDLIVIDSPPILALAHAHVLASLADATLLVIRWKRTSPEIVRHAVCQISRFGGHICGAVLSVVNVAECVKYDDVERGYFSKKNESYYAE